VTEDLLLAISQEISPEDSLDKTLRMGR